MAVRKRTTGKGQKRLKSPSQLKKKTPSTKTVAPPGGFGVKRVGVGKSKTVRVNMPKADSPRGAKKRVAVQNRKRDTSQFPRPTKGYSPETTDGDIVNQREYMFHLAQTGQITNKQYAEGVYDDEGNLQLPGVNTLYGKGSTTAQKWYIADPDNEGFAMEVNEGSRQLREAQAAGTLYSAKNILTGTTPLDSRRFLDQEQADGRRPAGAPVSPEAGAGGMALTRPQQTGFTPDNFAGREEGQPYTLQPEGRKPLAQRITDIEDKRVEDLRWAKEEGKGQEVENTIKENARIQIAEARAEEQDEQREQLFQAEMDKFKAEEASAAEARTASTVTSNITQGFNPVINALKSSMSALAPEEQGIVGAYISALASGLDGINTEISANSSLAEALIGGGTVKINGKDVTLQGTGIYDTANNIIEEMKTQQKQMSNRIDDMLKDSRDMVNRQLTNQASAERARNVWDEQQLLADAEKRKTQTHDSMIAQYALGGGFGQDLALQDVRETDEEFEQGMEDIKMEMGMQRSEIAVKYAGLRVQNEVNYRTKSMENLREMIKSLQNLSLQSLANTKAKATAENKVVTDWFNQESKLRKEKSDITKDYVKEINSMITTEKKNKETMAYNMFTWAFANSNDPILRGKAVKMMTDAGYNMTGVDLTAMTPAQQISLMSKAKDTKNVDLMDPFNYTGEDREIMFDANNAANKLGGDADMKKKQVAHVGTLLEQGEKKRAKAQLRGMVVSSLGGSDATEFSARELLSNEADKLIEDLKTLSDKGVVRGIYSKTWQELRKYFNKSKDPKWKDISSRMSLISAEEIHRVYGARLAPNEEVRAEEWAPTSRQTVRDAMNNLYNMSQFMKGRNEAIILRRLGKGVDTETEYDSNNAIDDIPNNNWYENLDNDGDGGGYSHDVSTADYFIDKGRITQSYSTPIQSRFNGGLYAESTVKAWGGKHRGLDIAMKPNTALESPIAGEVIEAGRKGDYGNTIVIRDKNGGEHRISHLNSIGVKVGQKLREGEIFGKSGSTGLSTGPHVDYRVRLHGSYIDPTTYFVS